MCAEKQWRWVVLAASYIGIVILCSTMFMGGILYVAILEKYPGMNAKASVIMSLNSGLLGLLGPVVTWITNGISCRFAMFMGGIFLAVSGLLSCLANSIDLLLITYGILGGIGNALIGVPFSVVLGFYFNKRRDFVIALSMSMVAFGILIGVPLVTILLDKYALNGTLLIIGAINSHLCVAGILCKPSRLELQLQAERRLDNTDKYQDKDLAKSARLRNQLRFIISHLRIDLFKNGTFTFFLWSTCLVNAVYAIIFVHLPNYIAVKGASVVQIAVLTTCFNAGNMVGRLLGTAVVAYKKLDLLIIHTVQVGFVGVISIFFPYYDVFEMAKYAFAVLVGLCTGAPFVLMTPISLQLVGVENMATAHGLEYFYFGCGFMVGPPIAGALFGQTGTYRDSFIFAGCLGVLGCIFAIVAKYRAVKRHAYPHSKLDDLPLAESGRTLLSRNGKVEEL